MPLIDDAKPKRGQFKKKNYRPWDLLGLDDSLKKQLKPQAVERGKDASALADSGNDKQTPGKQTTSEKRSQGKKKNSGRAETGSHYASDRESTGSHYASDRESTGSHYASDWESTGSHYASDWESTGSHYASDRESTGSQYASDQESVGHCKSTDQKQPQSQAAANALTGSQKRLNRESLESKNTLDWESTGSHYASNRESLEGKNTHDRESTGSHYAPDWESLEGPDSLHRETVAAPKLLAKKRLYTRHSAQRSVLAFLISQCDARTGKTKTLGRALIASECSLIRPTVKTALQRLMRSGTIESLQSFHSSTHGGAVYRIPKDVRKQMESSDQDRESLGKRLGVNWESNGDVSSSSYINNYKQTEELDEKKSSLVKTREQRESVETWSVRLNLNGLGVGLNDLFPILRKWTDSFEDFLVSLEHLAFYLRTPAAGSIKTPKAWLLAQLRSGYYAQPADFVSWADQQAAAKTRNRQEQAERSRKIRMQELEAEYELWLDGLSPPERQGIFASAGDLHADFVTVAMQKRMLRDHFARLHSVPEFADGASESEN